MADAKNDLYDRKLFEFPVLWSGWEMDNKGWIAEKNGKRVVVLTSHGSEYIATEAELAKRIKEYRTALGATKEAVRMLHGHDVTSNQKTDRRPSCHQPA